MVDMQVPVDKGAAVPVNDIASNLNNIQGNILGPFNKDFQEFLFLHFTADAPVVRIWLAEIVGQVATSDEVIAFNSLFKTVKGRRNREGTVKATWMNIAFTHSGLTALGAAQADLDSFPTEFKDGMNKRHNVEIFPGSGLTLGDVNESDPSNWIEPFKSSPSSVHAVMLIAADTKEDLEDEIAFHTQLIYGVGNVLYEQAGRTRIDDPGHEHFGFKDGISQPGIRGVTPPNPNNPQQGDPGQDLLWPGEFVLGYPKQPGSSETDPSVPGPVSTSGPDWTKDGSYLVFRRLRQDVKGFRDFVASQAQAASQANQVISPAFMGAKLVGRYESGAPLELAADPNTLGPTFKDIQDPSLANPGVLGDDQINNFEYDNDPDGKLVPRAAHIRKVYPRNEPTPGGQFDPAKSEADTQTRRLLRRGIPFGLSFKEGAPANSPEGADAAFPHDRGLLFLAYQTSIANQFEFVQGVWVNNPNFPRPADGQDPVMAQKDNPRTFAVPGASTSPLALLKNWVITTGGDYFFQPSISGLKHLAGEN